MALQVYGAAPRTPMMQNTVSQGILTNKLQPTMVFTAVDYPHLMMKRQLSRRSLTVKSSSDAAAAAAAIAVVGQVTEVTMHTFWPIVESAGDKTVVVDMYTQWCGPCKVIAPKYQELSEKYDDVVFLKLDCNNDNRPLAKELGIKVVPTFKVLKDGKIVKEVTGAKMDDLVAAIENARACT